MMRFESQVGVEAEFLVLNSDGEVILPPVQDVDDFPLLGEIRGLPGDSAPRTVSNFFLRKMEIEHNLGERYSMHLAAIQRVGLEVYRQAMRRCEKPKSESMSECKNLYGTDITDFSDQVIEKGKIQGINASCGLHIHFSCRATDTVKVEIPKYTHVEIPVGVHNAAEGQKELVTPYLDLYKSDGYARKEDLRASTSVLNRPTIEWMVRTLDEKFFERFAPEQRTKYRQPGFYELKPYGFEYRSLPASPETVEALPEIVEEAFRLLSRASEYVRPQ